MTLVQTTAEKIKTKGHWAITIRPAEFKEDRIPSRSELFPLVYDTAVSTNGRIIPAIDSDNEPLNHGSDWIEFSSEWSTDIQSWRFYQSGQFVLLLAVWTDWVENPAPRHVPYPSGRIFPLWDSLATFAAIYEFAARLAITAAGSTQMIVKTAIKNLQGAQLVQDNLHTTSLRHYEFLNDSFEYPTGKATAIDRAALVANHRQFAAEAGNELLLQFGFQSTVESVLRMQSEF